jgi:hypothetical protein
VVVDAIEAPRLLTIYSKNPSPHCVLFMNFIDASLLPSNDIIYINPEFDGCEKSN